MKQVCPLYRVQFSMKWHNSCDRQTDRQTDRQGLFCSLLFCAVSLTTVDSQARSDRSFFGRDAPFCARMTMTDMGKRTKLFMI